MFQKLIPFTLLAAPQALACGGFFCQTEDVDQSAERIIFAVDEEESKVETHVQISYQGSAQEFAWVVPVATVPDLFLSTQELFSNLEVFTRPRFDLDYNYIGCTFESDTDTDTDSDSDGDGDTDFADTGAAPSPPVVVVSEEAVGPYDTVVLLATSSDALMDWLNDNGYALPSLFGPKLDPYVNDGAYFVALRLQNGKSAGDIEPIGMRYEGTQPAIPITLTGVAAVEDMRLEVYVFGESRAVPENYLHVQLNHAAFDWIFKDNYDAVVTDAANEAGGHAFATDFSGPTANLRGLVMASGEFDRLDDLASNTDTVAVVDQVMGLVSRGNPTLLQLLRTHLPMPPELAAQGISDTSFYNCLSCYGDHVDGMPFDSALFIEDVRTYITDPIEHAETLFEDHSTVTRLRSSMSPDEMTLDPQFVFNEQMAAVDTVRHADLYVQCDGQFDVGAAPLVLKLEDGRRIHLPSLAEIYADPESYRSLLSGDSAEIIEQTGPAGEPERLVDLTGTYTGPIISLVNPGDDPIQASCAGGCATGSPGAGFAAILFLTGMVGGRRRHQGRSSGPIGR